MKVRHPVDGPLRGITLLEFGGLGPAPQVAWQLADLGAVITTVLPPHRASLGRQHDRPERSYQHLDLRTASGRKAALDLVREHDVLLEGFRPGVMERFGLGPEDCRDVREDLIYVRMTGWGQTGPWASMAGHDINYIGLTGVLGAITDHAGRPVPPLNLVGDSGGGTMFALVGILAALLERSKTGGGSVIDAAIVDGTVQLSNLVWQLAAVGSWRPDPRSNEFDGGAPYYDVYECADGAYMAVGALEPAFYAEFLRILGLKDDEVPDRRDRSNWAALRALFAERIGGRTRAQWEELSAGTDACFTPVLRWHEVEHHPHMGFRGVLAEGIPARAPRIEPLGTAGGVCAAGDHAG